MMDAKDMFSGNNNDKSQSQNKSILLDQDIPVNSSFSSLSPI